jgi:tRNA wybutosine-synthesizing protein 1
VSSNVLGVDVQTEGFRGFFKLLKRQKYQLLGGGAAVKKCRWLHKSLTVGKGCYKQKFYGVESHRCVQMTPTLRCNLKCRFCWRAHPSDVGLNEKGWGLVSRETLDAESIVKRSLEAQRKILSGYKSQVLSGRIERKKYEEALSPRHVAISLDGEPTLWHDLDGLIEAYRRAGLTTFLVTNGTRPDVLKNLGREPTQLYISLYAPNEKVFKNVCLPSSLSLWRDVLSSLSLLQSFKCPTVVRLTLVKDLNLLDPKGYGKIVEDAEPTYVEAKAYMYVGFSRMRLAFNNMPSHEDVKRFAEEVSKETGYRIVDECLESRVVLMSKLDKPIKLNQPISYVNSQV